MTMLPGAAIKVLPKDVIRMAIQHILMKQKEWEGPVRDALLKENAQGRSAVLHVSWHDKERVPDHTCTKCGNGAIHIGPAQVTGFVSIPPGHDDAGFKMSPKGTDYWFEFVGAKIRYLDDAHRPPGSPTATFAVDEDTFLDIYRSRLSIWGAFHHNKLIYTSKDNNPMYHFMLLTNIIDQMRLVEKLREA